MITLHYIVISCLPSISSPSPARMKQTHIAMGVAWLGVVPGSVSSTQDIQIKVARKTRFIYKQREGTHSGRTSNLERECKSFISFGTTHLHCQT